MTYKEEITKLIRASYDQGAKDAQQETLAALEQIVAAARADEREACSRIRAAKPRELKPVGRGTLLDEQQFCFDKGWREGAASVRAAIRARGSNT